MLVPVNGVVRVCVVQGNASLVTQLFDLINVWGGRGGVKLHAATPAPRCGRGDDRPALTQLYVITKVHLIIHGHQGSSRTP